MPAAQKNWFQGHSWSNPENNPNFNLYKNKEIDIYFTDKVT